MDATTGMRCCLVGLALATATWPATTLAGTVTKCLGPAGQVIFTSSGCPEGTRPGTTYEATPEPEIDPPPASGKRGGGRGAGLSSPQAGKVVRGVAPRRRSGRGRADASKKRCEAARAKRAATLERVGLERTFDLLRKLDDQVRNACASPTR